MPRPGLVLAALTLAACGGSSTDKATVVDSAGVTIVTSSGTDRELGWTFTEEWRIGGEVEGPESFSRLTPFSVGVDRNGTVNVLDAGPALVYRFGSNGRYRGTVGGKGGGPGEITQAFGLAVKSDGEVLVHDIGSTSLVRWGPEGEVLSRLAAVPPRLGAGSPSLLSARGDTLVGVTATYMMDSARISVVAITPRDTVTVASVIQHGASMVDLGCVRAAQTPLFSPSINYSLGDRGVLVVKQPGYAVDIHTGGKLVGSIRRAVAPRAPTLDDARSLYPDGYRPLGGDDRNRCVIPAEVMMEKAGVAERFPAIARAIPGPRGELWVERYTLSGQTPSIDVFDADGRYMGTHVGLKLPFGFTDPDHAIIAVADPDTDIPYLVSYRIDRGGTRR